MDVGTMSRKPREMEKIVGMDEERQQLHARARPRHRVPRALADTPPRFAGPDHHHPVSPPAHARVDLLVLYASNVHLGERTCLLYAITAARLSSRAISPLAEIPVQGALRLPLNLGQHRVCSGDHRRWRFVNEALRQGGNGMSAICEVGTPATRKWRATLNTIAQGR
ncbi:hypothetical protein FIBSPDRAFT_165136 [Athelia psychrophila]|uniref:Uncharacterized protein n=1 Tax=Athelia psychrophila TaxID=1759441 RepID=A0A166B321_9AGAM|nr:hypothetical protein FIBSPDRAFT_165136 [Fibularhizoctonia sp. CBS 109695]